MREHYVEGRRKGGAWKVIVPVMLVLTLMVGGVAWLIVQFFVWVFG